MKPSWMGWQGRGQCPNFTDVLLPHRPTILLPPDPCPVPLLAQRSLEVLLLTVPTPFPNSWPDLLLYIPGTTSRKVRWLTHRWPFMFIFRRNQQSSITPHSYIKY